jgi:23S rRNA pseudouridine1911/1915/1917 synthase
MFLECPIVGDKIYGHRKQLIELDRHFLHAIRLKIILPGEKQPKTFEAPLPDELGELLDTLRTKR